MADPKYVVDFVREMTPWAVAVGDYYGIDPVTIITQAAVETGWGREVAGNNYFGVKSHGRPGGQNITTHEEVDGKRIKTTANFRVYDDMGASVADYGRFLSENPRYADAVAQEGYADELGGITEAGYATDSSYGSLTRGVAGIVNRNLPPLPPGSIPNVVGTQLDTKRGAAAKGYGTNDFGRMVKTDTGAFLPPSSPVLQSIVAGRQAIDNTRPREYPNARTVMLPPIEPSKLRNSTAVPQSLIERGVPRIASASKAAPQSITERPAPRGLLDSLANTRNAGDAIALAPVMGGKQNPVFDAGYDTEQGVMQRFQSPVGEMPTLEGTRAAFHLAPMRSILGEPPATRAVPSIAVTAPLAGPRDGIEKGPGVFANIASILGPRQPAADAGGRQPPVTAPYSNPLTASDRARLAQNAPKVSAPRETEVSLGDVMSPRYPNVAAAEPGPTWAEFTGTMHSPRIPGLDAPIKAGERLPRVAALSFEPRAAAPVVAPPPAYKGPFVPAANPAPTYRTVMRDAQVENPAYTRWKQDTLNKPGYIPLGEVSHPLSRDSLIPAAAGANFVANKMPAQWLTVQRPVQIRVAAPAVPRPVVVQPVIARPAYTPPRPIVANAIPAPVRTNGLFGAITSGAQSTLGGLLGRLVGPNQNVGGMVQGGVNGLVAKLVADQRAGNMPVGAYLGPAANGGAMFQGHNGVLNNLTQASDWWQTVTGQSDRSRGDGGAQSLSGTQN